jgi:hypothetical protein
MQSTPTPTFRSWLAIGLLLALAGGALCLASAGGAPALLWRAYYFGVMTCWPVVLGGMGLVALGNLTGGRWAAGARPYYLAAVQTLPIVMLLFIPLAFGLDHVFPWASANYEHGGEFSPSKAAYLSPGFFLGRAAGYIVVWLSVGGWLGAVSRLDRPPGSRPGMRRAGAVSLVLLVPTATFAAFDWVMSLEPQWYSSIYGAIITAGGVVAAHALAIVGLAVASPGARAALHITRPHAGEGETLVYFDLLNDLGNLLLAFIMVWTYFSFSQFFLIWSANLPSEIIWYERRLTGGWGWVALALVVVCFAAPFMALLSRDAKREPGKLMNVAALVLAGYVLNMFWIIVPAFPTAEVRTLVAMLGAAVGLAGLWLAVYGWRLGRLAALGPRSHGPSE